VIMACHDRRVLTVRAVELAQAAAEEAAIDISFTIFDDGSVDGTAEALSAMPHAIRVLHGDGNAYWARSMAVAEAAVLGAVAQSSDEFILWLNDDVELDPGSLAIVKEMIDKNPGAVVVGGTRDAVSGDVTYSGMARRGLHPLGFGLVPPNEPPQFVETFNGNFVVVPVAVARLLGGIDGGFSHALADVDYGLRCGRVGVPIVLAPETIGVCARNPPSTRRALHLDWLAFTGTKGGGNYLSLRRILRKSNPHSWLAVVGATYALWWARRLLPAHYLVGEKK
jgi:GT2 family glycosyltransferase